METDNRRSFGLWTAAALVVGSMIGSGIFVLPSVMAPLGWTGVGAWFAAIAGAMLIATVLTKLTALMPQQSGIVAIIGSALGPLPSVLFGWSFWVGVWSSNAIISITAVNYLGAFWPGFTETPLHTACYSVGLLWLLTLLNLRGARAVGQFQVVTTLLKLMPLIAVAGIAIMLLAQGGGQFTAHPRSEFSFSALPGAIALVFLAMVGFEAASITAERVRDPGRNILRATLAGLALTGLLYMIVSTGVVFSMPEAQVAASSAPIALFVETFWGQRASLVIAAFAVIASVGCLNGWVMMSGEAPLGMARAGLLPRWMAHTNRHDVAAPLLIVATTLSSILILSSANKTSGALLEFMLQLTTVASMWVYLGGCLSAIKMGVLRPLAVLGIVFVCWVVWGAGMQALLLSSALIIVAIPLYFLALRGGKAGAARAA